MRRGEGLGAVQIDEVERYIRYSMSDEHNVVVVVVEYHDVLLFENDDILGEGPTPILQGVAQQFLWASTVEVGHCKVDWASFQQGHGHIAAVSLHRLKAIEITISRGDSCQPACQPLQAILQGI